MTDPIHNDFTVEPKNGERLSNLVEPLAEHLHQIELRLGAEIATRGNVFCVNDDRRPLQPVGVIPIVPLATSTTAFLHTPSPI